MPKRPKVPGTPASRSYQIPICKDCGSRCQKDENGQWFCLKCADEWLGEIVRARHGRHTASGIELPAGVVDPAKEHPSFRDLMLNRATRRRLAHTQGREYGDD